MKKVFKDPRGGARKGSGRKKAVIKNESKIERLNPNLKKKLNQKRKELNKTWNEFLAYLSEKIDNV